MVAAFVGATYQVTSIWLEYFRYDVIVSKTFTYQRQTVFPAVTLCNMNPVKRSAVDDNPLLSSVASQQQRRRRQASESAAGNVDVRSLLTDSVPSMQILPPTSKDSVLLQPSTANDIRRSPADNLYVQSSPADNMQPLKADNITTESSEGRQSYNTHSETVLSRHKRSSTYLCVRNIRVITHYI